MNRQQIVARVRSLTRDLSNSIFREVDVVDYINEAIDRVMQIIPQMQKNIARVMGISENRVSVKATTEEGLGFTGSGKGIAAYAVCLIEETDK